MYIFTCDVCDDDLQQCICSSMSGGVVGWGCERERVDESAWPV
jgi:hypothetical protein